MSGHATIEEQFGFEMDLDLKEDVQAELEDFILLARLGVEDEALHLARTVLWHHIHHFPVFAEVAGFLLEHRLNDQVQELIFTIREKDIQFPLEGQQVFTRLVHGLHAKTLDEVDLLRQLLREHLEMDHVWDLEEASHLAHQPIPAVKTHSVELVLRHVKLSHVRRYASPLNAVIHRDIVTHYGRLIKYGLHWEAAQIFGLISTQSRPWRCVYTHLRYRRLMLATGEPKLIADIQNDRASDEGGIEDALAIVSAKATYAKHFMHCKACTQKRDVQVLKDSFTILLRWLFRRLPNTQPRGKLFYIQTRLSAFLLENSVDQSQPTRYGSSRDTGRGTELACGEVGILLTPKPDTIEDATENGTKSRVGAEKSARQLKRIGDRFEQDSFPILSSSQSKWQLTQQGSLYGSSDNSYRYHGILDVPSQQRHTRSPPAPRGNQYGSTIITGNSRVHVGNAIDSDVKSYVKREHAYSGAATGESAPLTYDPNYEQLIALFSRPPTPTGKSSE
ncbi:hypothetical protein LTR05_007641 [Lithohypha guttulata]|uniref:Uncharacterized protein n=1 Tax=Lithohypha guttulata TaxID=1690604 RepID=A0AAN7SU33_9EURO|nr:hypothetical protein LTR05_007641 [Lithohypha guttulata]